MKLLIEKLIDGISESDAASLDRTDPEKVMQVVHTASIFPNQPAIKSYEDVVADSIRKYGLDTARNKFLPFVVKNNIPIGEVDAKIIQKAFQEGQINLTPGSFASQWLYDERAYTGHTSKLNALVILSDPDEAAKYADPKTRKDLLKTLLPATTKEDIGDALDNWQTKDGTDADARGGGKKGRGGSDGKSKATKISKSDSDDVRKAKLLDNFKGRYGLSDKDIKSIIDTNYDGSKDLKTIFSKIESAISEKAGLTTETD